MSAEFQWPPVSTRERTDGISSDGLGARDFINRYAMQAAMGMVT